MVDASVTHLLRTCLAKNTKDTTVNPTPLAMLKDTTKLKKHIALLCDRLNKGGTLAIEGMDMTETKAGNILFIVLIACLFILLFNCCSLKLFLLFYYDGDVNFRNLKHKFTHYMCSPYSQH